MSQGEQLMSNVEPMESVASRLKLSTAAHLYWRKSEREKVDSILDMMRQGSIWLPTRSAVAFRFGYFHQSDPEPFWLISIHYDPDPRDIGPANDLPSYWWKYAKLFGLPQEVGSKGSWEFSNADAADFEQNTRQWSIFLSYTLEHQLFDCPVCGSVELDLDRHFDHIKTHPRPEVHEALRTRRSEVRIAVASTPDEAERSLAQALPPRAKTTIKWSSLRVNTHQSAGDVGISFFRIQVPKTPPEEAIEIAAENVEVAKSKILESLSPECEILNLSMKPGSGRPQVCIGRGDTVDDAAADARAKLASDATVSHEEPKPGESGALVLQCESNAQALEIVRKRLMREAVLNAILVNPDTARYRDAPAPLKVGTKIRITGQDAVTQAAATASAVKKLPAGAAITQVSQLPKTDSARRRPQIRVQGATEGDAVEQARNRLEPGQELGAVTIAVQPRSGLLGIGRRPGEYVFDVTGNAYEAEWRLPVYEVTWKEQSQVKLTYVVPAKVLVTYRDWSKSQ